MDFELASRLGLLLIRTGMLVTAAPVFGGMYAPAHVKVGLIVLLSITLAPKSVTVLGVRQ